MEEFAYTDEERSRMLVEEKEPWDKEKRFAPTIKDADPDDGPVPKDGCTMTWLGWYWRVMREKVEEGKRTPNVFCDLLFDRYPGDNTVNNKKKPEKVAKLRQGRSRKSGSNLFYLCSFIEV
jgi:hypothetical protein